MARLLRVRANRTFNHYRVGDEVLLEETAEVKAEIKAKLLDLVAVEKPADDAPKKGKGGKEDV